MASNLHISVRCPESKEPPLPERMEQKFFIAPKDVAWARALLRRTCRLDPQFPVGQVNSVYFDTMDLDQHERSTSGDLVKDKVRIRWYGEELDPHRPLVGHNAAPPVVGRKITVWLELKSRRGFSSTKQRLPLSVLSERLAWQELPYGIVPPNTLTYTMARFGFFPPGRILPVITISYFRHRFVEPVTGYRLSIDSNIRSSLLIPGRGCNERGLELPGAVVEVKSPSPDLPLSLRELVEIGSSWTRLSKYSACHDSHDSVRGAVARLWPSGFMEGEPGAISIVKATARRERPPQQRGRESSERQGPTRTHPAKPRPAYEEYETE
jgi:hypothetical protein